MGKLVVAWKDNKGVEYNATTLYDPETETFYDWNGQEAEYQERGNDMATERPEASNE